MDLQSIRERLRDEGLDGWLFFDHHHRDPLAYRVLGLSPTLHVSRRWYYLVPAEGSPRKMMHRVESHVLAGLEGETRLYSSWDEQTRALGELLRGCRRVAMQYSPNCEIPYVSNVDGGTLELVRSCGVEVVSSAELIQHFEARLNERSLETHLTAGKIVDRIRGEAFQFIADGLRAKRDMTEWDVAGFIREQFAREELVTDNGPIAAVNANAGDPHYEPSPQRSARIRPGDFVLLDMWAKLAAPDAIYYDITWTGICAASPEPEVQRVFETVRDARKAACQKVERAFADGCVLRGFEVDDAAREVVRNRGFGDRFVHRTGHSIGVEVHGNGANMDNLETHDVRIVTPWSCFSVEPGVYLQNFGVRSEVNMFIDANRPRITGEQQEELVRIV